MVPFSCKSLCDIEVPISGVEKTDIEIIAGYLTFHFTAVIMKNGIETSGFRDSEHTKHLQNIFKVIMQKFPSRPLHVT
jgi:hypothetical protein